MNGREISREAVQRKYYFALNKPKGFICRWAMVAAPQLLLHWLHVEGVVRAAGQAR